MNNTFYKSVLLQLLMLLFFGSLHAQTITVEIVRHVKKYTQVNFVNNEKGLKVPVVENSQGSLQWVGLNLPTETPISIDFVPADTTKYPLKCYVRESENNNQELKVNNRNDTINFYGSINWLKNRAGGKDYHQFIIGTDFKKLKAVYITYN